MDPLTLVPTTWLIPESIQEAMNAQHEMAQKVSVNTHDIKNLTYIAGVDVSHTPFDPDQMIFGSAVLLSYPDLNVLETKTQADRQTFPYIPGLLGFREVPTLVAAYRQLMQKPDLIFVDGHGVSHPRGLGIASHLGVLLDVPTIGVAKSILVGKPQEPLGETPGSSTPLIWKGNEIARMLRTKRRCLPLIISSGHKITLDKAVELVMGCLRSYRLPEPTRQAHLAANVCRKAFKS